MYSGTYLSSMQSHHTDSANDTLWRRTIPDGQKRKSRDMSPLPISTLDENNSGNHYNVGMSPSTYSHSRALSGNVSYNLPPPPPSTSATSPTVPLYRKHSRKKSSQVLVPPIQVSRRKNMRHASTSNADLDLGDGGLNITTDKRSSFIEKSESSSDDDVKNSIAETNENENEIGQEKIVEEDANDVEVEESSDVGQNLTTHTLASGATFLIGAQFFSKLITFTLNQMLLKFVGPSLLGINAQFELFTNTILFFSREAIRLATQRQTLVGKRQDVYRFEGGVAHGTQSGTIQEVINIGFVPFLVGIPISIIISSIYYLGWSSTNDYIGTSTIILAVSCLIELASEPSFVLSQLLLDFKTRASIESAAITSRCLITFIFVLLSKKTFGPTIILFALGQLAYSLVTSGLYFVNGFKITRHRQYQLLYLQGIWKESGGGQKKIYFNQDTKRLAVGMWLQTVFKHILTEGDKLLVSLVLPIADQGVYALIANYGSLIARLGFLPIEEALRSFFSKLLAVREDGNDYSPSVTSPLLASPSASTPLSVTTPSITPSITTPSMTAPSLNIPSTTSSSLPSPSLLSPSLNTDSPPPETTPLSSELNLSITVLSTILRSYFYLNLIICTFGPLAAQYILSILVSPAWLLTDAPKVLATYACYIPFLAINGCLEAFVQSVASVEDLKDQGRVMIFFSLSFAIAGYVFMVLMKLGAQGLIFANILNMSLRIAWCVRFISNYYLINDPKSDNWQWLKSSIPNRMILTASVVVASIAWNLGVISTYKDLIKQSILGAGLLVVVLFYEKDVILQSLLKVKKR